MKKSIIIFFALIFIGDVKDSRAALTDSLVACYSFTGNANDESGNGNHGTLVNAALTADRFGNSNSAYSFNGSTAYITLPADSFLNNNYTYSAWVKTFSTPSFGSFSIILAIGSSGGDQFMSLQNYGSFTGWDAGVYSTGGTTQHSHVGTLPAINTWYHVVSVRDSSSLKLYVNGVLMANTPAPGLPYYGTAINKSAFIGARWNLSTKFDGVIDDIRIYKRALKDIEVSALYTGGSNCSSSTLCDATFTWSTHDCVGEGVNFYSADSSVSATHSWYFGSMSSAVPVSSTQKNPGNVIYSQAGAYYVKHIITEAGCSDTVVEIITINPVPTASFTTTSPVCVGSTVNFTNTGSAGVGYTYSWDFGSGANPATAASQHPSAVHYSLSGAHLITQYITNQFGCMAMATGTVTINALPNAKAGKDTVICAATSVQIGSSSVATYSYNWFPTSTLGSSTLSNPTASPVAPVSNYVVTVKDLPSGCVNMDTISVTMLSPVTANAGTDAELCFNESINIGSSSLPDLIYSWMPSTGLSDTAVSNPLATAIDTITYVLTVTDSLGCGPAIDSVTVIVHPLPNVYASVDDTITLGSSTQLNASGAIQYAWTPTGHLNTWGIYNPIASPSVTTDYIVKGIDVYGCENSDTATITVIKPNLWLPAGFTPDNNGHNDILYVRGEGINNFEFGIFDRWGARIFFTTDMKQGWDGNRQPTGEVMPQGAYVYFIKGVKSNKELVDINGMVNLIR